MTAKDQMETNLLMGTSRNDVTLMNQEMSYRGVFHSLEAVLAPLKNEQYASLPEVIELLNIYKNSLSKFPVDGNVKRKPFIVLEGLDGSGKSTITKILASKLRGSKMSTPPASVSHLRLVFDKHEPVLRRAYYALGNYIAAQEVKFITCKTPVVMDRFWNSTAAYAIGNEVKSGKALPSEDSPLYQWPSDLLLPDYVIYLSVTENVRLNRLKNREAFTQEENELKANAAFRKNLEETYKRFRPSLHFVNANFAPKKVVIAIKTDVLKTELA